MSMKFVDPKKSANVDSTKVDQSNVGQKPEVADSKNKKQKTPVDKKKAYRKSEQPDDLSVLYPKIKFKDNHIYFISQDKSRYCNFWMFKRMIDYKEDGPTRLIGNVFSVVNDTIYTEISGYGSIKLVSSLGYTFKNERERRHTDIVLYLNSEKYRIFKLWDRVRFIPVYNVKQNFLTLSNLKSNFPKYVPDVNSYLTKQIQFEVDDKVQCHNIFHRLQLDGKLIPIIYSFINNTLYKDFYISMYNNSNGKMCEKPKQKFVKLAQTPQIKTRWNANVEIVNQLTNNYAYLFTPVYFRHLYNYNDDLADFTINVGQTRLEPVSFGKQFTNPDKLNMQQTLTDSVAMLDPENWVLWKIKLTDEEIDGIQNNVCESDTITAIYRRYEDYDNFGQF